jgi:hypothetical protein
MSHTLPNLAPPILRTFKAIRMGLEVHHRLVDFFLGVEDKRAILDNFLVERQTSYED